MTTTIVETNAKRGMKRRLSRRELLSTVSMMLLVGCITIVQCLAFQMTNPYANRGFGRLLAKSETEDVSSSSNPLIDSYDRREFEMQVGRAMDTLRDDYPEFLVQDLGTLELICFVQSTFCWKPRTLTSHFSLRTPNQSINRLLDLRFGSGTDRPQRIPSQWCQELRKRHSIGTYHGWYFLLPGSVRCQISNVL